jgi:hypothetical protein
LNRQLEGAVGATAEWSGRSIVLEKSNIWRKQVEEQQAREGEAAVMGGGGSCLKATAEGSSWRNNIQKKISNRIYL